MWLTCSGSQWGASDQKDFIPVALLFCSHISRIDSAGASSCPEVLPQGGRAADRPASAPYSWGAARFVFTEIQSWELWLTAGEVRTSHTDPCPAWAFLGNPGAAVAAPICPSQTSIASTPGFGKQTKRPLLCCSPRATNNGLLFPGSCRENYRYFFLFCSANTSCSESPISLDTSTKEEERESTLKENHSSGALTGDGDVPGKVAGE